MYKKSKAPFTTKTFLSDIQVINAFVTTVSKWGQYFNTNYLWFFECYSLKFGISAVGLLISSITSSYLETGTTVSSQNVSY